MHFFTHWPSVSPSRGLDFRSSESVIRTNICSINEAYRRAGLSIIYKKTDALSQLARQQAASSPSISVQRETLNNIHQFTYLGSILTDNLDPSVKYRIVLDLHQLLLVTFLLVCSTTGI